jgi:hypothetical protein
MRNIIFGNDDRLGIIERIASKANSGVEDTWWGCYNALTEHLTWAYGGEGGDKTTPADKANNRLAALWFGKNQGVNQNALAVAVEMSAA